MSDYHLNMVRADIEQARTVLAYEDPLEPDEMANVLRMARLIAEVRHHDRMERWMPEIMKALGRIR